MPMAKMLTTAAAFASGYREQKYHFPKKNECWLKQDGMQFTKRATV
jgi:hypothetical protein